MRMPSRSLASTNTTTDAESCGANVSAYLKKRLAFLGESEDGISPIAAAQSGSWTTFQGFLSNAETRSRCLSRVR